MIMNLHIQTCVYNMHMRTFVMTQQANHIQFIPVATLRKRRLRIGSKVCHSFRKWQTANRATWTNIRISDTMTSSDSLPLLCLPTDMGLPPRANLEARSLNHTQITTNAPAHAPNFRILISDFRIQICWAPASWNIIGFPPWATPHPGPTRRQKTI